MCRDVGTDCQTRHVASSVFGKPPDEIQRSDVVVMQQTTVDDLTHIRDLWHAFEALVGLRGRKMYGCVDVELKTYTTCTPVREGDDPDALGLRLGMLPGGAFLRGRLVGDPPRVYERIGPGMAELAAIAAVDRSRPLVEFYRRRNEIELWVPVVVLRESVVTCPACGGQATETMPEDACVHVYRCTHCGALLRPYDGDCCVFCSYGTVRCPPKQNEAQNDLHGDSHSC